MDSTHNSQRQTGAGERRSSKWRFACMVAALAAAALFAGLMADSPATPAHAGAPAQAPAPGALLDYSSPVSGTVNAVYLPYVSFQPTDTPTPTPTATPTSTPMPTSTPLPPGSPLDPANTELGLVFVNSAENPSGAERIERGAASGAHFDRFPFYWTNIERQAGLYDWSAQDAVVRSNGQRGLRTLAILLGTPGQYYAAENAGEAQMPPIGASFLRLNGSARTDACGSPAGPPAPLGLNEPAFGDGTDLPGSGKVANPNNPWARFVEATVLHFRAGTDIEVRDWEIWNEPDLCQFWSGTSAQYARLLKVAYLVIKRYDPDATVVWGGLAHFENPQFLYDLVNTLKNDARSAQFDGYFDAAAGHQYAITWNGYTWTKRVRDALDAAGWQAKPIWITESGVPVCDDYPGPSCPSPWRARPEEQASYIWQNIAYTRLAGGGPIFQFMLHDDCGNVVDPHSPDGFGMVKNESSSYCSPANAELRVAYKAYQLAAQYLRGTELLWANIQDGVVRRFAFYEPASRQRRLLTFSISADAYTARIPAAGTQARRLSIDGTELAMTPVNGEYQIVVPGATNRNWPNGAGGYDIGIYGKPYLLIETDNLPPTTRIGALPPTSPASFAVSWEAADLGSGLATVEIWTRTDEEPWQQWLAGQAATGSAVFNGAADRHYRFAAMATDRAGNRPIEPMMQAETWTGSTTPAVSVSGTVVNVAGQAAPGVAVTVGAAAATTDGSGRFQLSAAPGRYDVQAGGQVVVHGQLISAGTLLSLLAPPAANAVANGDFEAGTNGWTASGSCPLATEIQPGTEDHATRLATSFVSNTGVPGEEGSWGGNSTLSQTLQVPSGRPYLALRYRVDSQETQSGHDKFEVILIQGGQAHYLHAQGTGSDWAYLSFDLSAYAGGQADLVFNVYQSSPNRLTSALIDRVTVGQ